MFQQTDHFKHAAEIAAAAREVRLTRHDINFKWRLANIAQAKSLASLPPPSTEISDEEIRRMMEPQPIRWPKDVIPNYRDTPAVNETIPYYRYSTDKQEYSIDYQRDAVRDWYDMRRDTFRLPPLMTKGRELDDIGFTAGFADPETSGSHRVFERRWGGQLGQYVRPGDHVVFAYFDRIGRNTVDTLQVLDAFVKARVYVHILDHVEFQFCDPAHPNTIKQIQDAAVAAEHHRGMTSLRTRRAYRSHLAAGVSMGGASALCYRRIPNPGHVAGVRNSRRNPLYRMEFVPFQAALVEEIFRLWLIESWSVAEICSALRERSKRDERFLNVTNNKPWDRRCIRYIIEKLRNERRAGGAAGMFQTAALNCAGGEN